MANKYGKKVIFANVIKGGKTKEGKEYKDFISVFKEVKLGKDTTLQLQTPAERVKELEEKLSFQEEKGYDTSITIDMLKNARKTVEMGKTRYVISYQDTTEA